LKPKYKILFTRTAHEDLRSIYKYIREEFLNINSAIKIVSKIEERIGVLKEFPLTGSPVQEAILASKGYRKLIIHEYLALYTVDEQKKEVRIIRVIYGKRDYQELL
jgi:toxin ParE1/3/4